MGISEPNNHIAEEITGGTCVQDPYLIMQEDGTLVHHLIGSV